MIRLKGVNARVVYSGRVLETPSQNIVTLSDNEFITLAGSNLLIFENSSVYSRKANILDSHLIDVSQIDHICISREAKYLGLVVKLKNNERNVINIYVFHTSNHMQDFLKPRHIKYTTKLNLRTYETLQVNCIAFSSNSAFLVCGMNQPACGIIIFEQFKGSVYQTIATESVPISVSFHPMDDAKIIVAGEDNLIKFWRFTAKSFHAAAVNGLRKGSHTYCCHEWIQPYSENVLVVGSTAGFLSVIQNCDQRIPAISMFGESVDDYPTVTPSSAITQLLVRGDHVIASSRSNMIVLFELRRVMISKSFVGLSVVLVPLAHYRIQNVEAICGLQFCFRESVTSYAMVATTMDSILSLDIIQDSDLSEDLLLHSDQENNKIEWREIMPSKPITSFHSKGIQSLSIAAYGKVLMTSSYQDQTVRFWNYDSNSIFNNSWLIESYKDRPIDDTPFFVDLHPSGLHVVCAYETEVKEFAICDNQLDLMRRFGVKSAFQSTSGIPIVISQPVSIVKYSNGGHLLAVVTGKICQLFHMFKCDENSVNQEAPCRIMTMYDHVSPISDIVFLRDDTQIITTSIDGSVYSWDVGAASRSCEYVQKGVAATHVAVSNKQNQDNLIFISFESNATHDPSTFVSETVRRRRASSVAVRRISTALNFGGSSDSHHDGPFPGGLRSSMMRSHDIAFAANAIAQAFEGGKHTLDGMNHAAPTQSRQASTASSRLNFLAIFTNQLSNNPAVVALDTPVRAIALGRTGQPDAFDFCALGLADGRIIISALPIPLMDISFANVRTYSIVSSNSSTISSPMGTRPNTMNMNTPSQKRNRRTAVTLPENTVLDSISDVLLTTTYEKEAQEMTTIVGEEAEEEFNINTLEHKTAPQQKINESLCKIMRLTVGSITNVRISPDGDNIIVAGEDGSVTILHTSKNKVFMTDPESSSEVKESDASALNSNLKSNQFLMIEKQKMFYLRQRVLDLDSIIQQSRKEYEVLLNKMLENKDSFIADLENKYKLEIRKRDDSILSSRNEYLLMKRNMQQEIEHLKKHAEDSLSTMELTYEKKLAHESTYLEKMKQAYDEYVVHARMDMLQLQQQTESKIKDVEGEKLKLIQDIEKEKSAVLKYYDYVQDRNQEVLLSLEEQQTNERLKLKLELQQTATKLQQAQQQNMSSEVQAGRKIQRLKVDIETREMEILRVNSDIDWANDRISKLETSLMQATNELKARSELLDKNENKIGELQQKIDDMERVRKTLTVQVHNLQSSLQPKENDLMKMTEKLQELTREYEISLQAITEKEAALQQKNENLLLLQKQVRELRSVGAQKESALRRAATFFEEFIYAMHEARFDAKKKVPLALQQQQSHNKRTVPGNNNAVSNGVESLVADNDNKDDNNANGGTNSGTNGAATGNHKKRDLATTTTSKGRELIAGLNLEFAADTKLKGLQDILKPYLVDVKVEAEILDDIEAVKQEQDRHLQLLHRNFQTLQNSMETANQAASNKVFNHLMDNQTLIKEVNNLRAEVRTLSLENHRLSAQLSFQSSQSRRNTALLNAIPSFDSSVLSQHEKPGGVNANNVLATNNSATSLLELQQEEIPMQAQMTFPSRGQKIISAPAVSSTGKALTNSLKSHTNPVKSQQKSDNNHVDTVRPLPSISSLLGSSTGSLPNQYPAKSSTTGNNSTFSNHGQPISDSLFSENVGSTNSKTKGDGKRSALKLATSQILLSSTSSTTLSNK